MIYDLKSSVSCYYHFILETLNLINVLLLCSHNAVYKTTNQTLYIFTFFSLNFYNFSNSSCIFVIIVQIYLRMYDIYTFNCISKYFHFWEFWLEWFYCSVVSLLDFVKVHDMSQKVVYHDILQNSEMLLPFILTSCP